MRIYYLLIRAYVERIMVQLAYNDRFGGGACALIVHIPTIKQ